MPVLSFSNFFLCTVRTCTGVRRTATVLSLQSAAPVLGRIGSEHAAQFGTLRITKKTKTEDIILGLSVLFINP